jgi:UDP-2,3-diacylglucosamine hydrolase
MINQIEAIGHVMQTIFISDLHLSEDNIEARQCFLAFLKNHSFSALYILGDFFEAWVGDDDEAPWITEICEALKTCGAKVFLMQGNRDFLLGHAFAQKCDAVLLRDPSVIDLYGELVVLTHGDVLCTEDRAYQCFRKFVRQVWLQKIFLKLPRSIREKIAQKLRQDSQRRVKNLSLSVMDVSSEAAKEMCEKYQVKHMIHGHTHKPQVHEESGHYRYVLPDWQPHGRGGMLVAEAGKSLKLVLF